MEKFELTLQDFEEMKAIDKLVEGRPDLEKAVEGPIKWVGKEGFNTCVAHLSKKKGITNAKALCGWMKGRARAKGQLAKEHMGRLERKRYKKK